METYPAGRLVEHSGVQPATTELGCWTDGLIECRFHPLQQHEPEQSPPKLWPGVCKHEAGSQGIGPIRLPVRRALPAPLAIEKKKVGRSWLESCARLINSANWD